MFDKKSISDIISNITTNQTTIIIIVSSVVFFTIAFYTYYYYIKPRIDEIYKPNKEFTTKDTSLTAELYYFYTEWCPHCKNARPIIKQLIEYIKSKNNKINDVEVLIHVIDCEKNTDVADSFNVENYPTIKLVYNDNVIEYDAKPELDHLIEFIESTTS
jgi:thiol-disulfide isomerase/thioredoxin